MFYKKHLEHVLNTNLLGLFFTIEIKKGECLISINLKYTLEYYI